jgi:putative transposase
MIFNRKVQVIFSKEDRAVLDGQSKICNWMYNILLEISIKDYTENNNEGNLLQGRNLRDLVPILKKEHNFLTLYIHHH